MRRIRIDSRRVTKAEFEKAKAKRVQRARSLKIAGPFADAAAGRDPAPEPPAKRLLSSLSSAERKTYPMTAGFLDYFPDACAYVSHVSFLGNQKHNPGEALHWARGKSMDHADCASRHLQERGTLDPEGVRHTGQLAWRSMALLQEELEAAFGLSSPRGVSPGPGGPTPTKK